MGIAEKKLKVTVEAYFAYLNSIDHKAEYYDGIIYDMAGGSPNHGLITMNCGYAIRLALGERNCGIYSSDVSVGIEVANSYVFPDLSVACGELELSPRNQNVILNPQIIVEVLSPSTIGNDRTIKLLRYMQIPSLREYLLIEQTEPRVDICFINDRGVWDSERVQGLEEKVSLRSLEIEIPMASLYHLVKFDK